MTIAPLQVPPSGASPLVLAVGLALAGVVFLYVSPWILPLLRAASKRTLGLLAFVHAGSTMYEASRVA